MLPEKAIELLEFYLQDTNCPFSSDARDAVKLGIEALTRHGMRNYLRLENILTPLPSETRK